MEECPLGYVNAEAGAALFMADATLMSETEFLRRFRAGLMAAWLLPLATSFLIISLLTDHTVSDLMRTLQHLVGVYTVAGVATGYVFLSRYMQLTVELVNTGKEGDRQKAEVRIARFPHIFAGLFAPYALASPAVVLISIAAQTDTAFSLSEYLFELIGAAPPAAVIVLIALYVFSDLVGRFFAPRGCRAHFFSLRMKVMALCIVMPLVVNTALILYFGHRMDNMGAEMFAIWGGLFVLSLPIAFFAQYSFNQSFGPLKKLRAQALNVLKDPDAIIDLVPVSLDELGDVTRDWTTLTRRMTRYWRDLENTTEHYRTLITAVDDAIAIVDFDTKAIFLGPGFHEWLGDAASTFVGQDLTELVHPEDVDVFRELAAESASNLECRPEGQVRLRHPDGTYHHVLCGWRRIKKVSGEPALFVSIRDISQQLIAQERLQAGEIRLRTMMQSVPDGILSTDENGVIQSVNPAAAEVFGYQPSELVGCGVGILLPDAVILAFSRSTNQNGRAWGLDKLVGRGAREMRGRRKDGSSFPMELSVTEMRIAEELFFVGVVRDVSASKKSKEHLHEALEAAETANKTKSLFLANMSHELRTPLNAIIGFSEIMKDQMFGPIENERYLDYMGSIHDSSRHLLSVINDILDISRIESGELELDEEWLDIEEELAWAQDRAAPEKSGPKSTAAHASIFMHTSDNLPELLADQRSFRQIMINLLSNAIKFTPVEGRIDLSAAVDEFSGLSICVKDTGVGIPAGKIANMTQPFTQSDNSLARRFEGTGLGLAITKSLVEAHGGRLEITSVEGRGTTVTVRMPAARVGNNAATVLAKVSLH